MDEELLRQLTEAITTLNSALGVSSDGLYTFNSATAGATTSINQLQDANLSLVNKTIGAIQTASTILNTANRAASNAQGSIEAMAGLDPTGLANIGTAPALLAEQQLTVSQQLAQQGTMFTNIEQLFRDQANLNITNQQLQQIGSNPDILRAQGGLATDVLGNMALFKQAVENIPEAGEDGQLIDGSRNLVQEMDALGFNTSQLSEMFIQLGSVLGPSVAVDLKELLDENNQSTPESRQAVLDFISVQEDLITNMVELSQTTGMSVDEQVKATKAIAETPGMLSQQLRNINNPQFNQNLTRFATTLQAIGASDLGEGFISGLGLPIGNEIEAALKPQSFAMMQQISQMIASGADPEEIRAAERQLQQIYNQETTNLVGELGAFAGVLGEEFGFLSRDSQNLRASILQTGADPNATAANQAAAQDVMNARMDDEIIGTLTETRQKIAGQTEQLVNAQADIVANLGLVSVAAGTIGAAAETLANSIELLRPDSEATDIRAEQINAAVESIVAEIKTGTFTFKSDPERQITSSEQVMLDDFVKLYDLQQAGIELTEGQQQVLNDILQALRSETGKRILDAQLNGTPADLSEQSGFNFSAAPNAVRDALGNLVEGAGTLVEGVLGGNDDTDISRRRRLQSRDGAYFKSDADLGLESTISSKDEGGVPQMLIDNFQTFITELRNIKLAIDSGADRQAGATTQAAITTSYSNQNLQKEVQLNSLTGVN